jgi:hypothetical protein
MLVTEMILCDDLVALYKRTGIWQSKTPAEQEGNIRHLEEGHITPEVVGKMAAKRGVKAVLMTHLVATIEPNDNYRRYVDGAKRYFSGPIILAKDLMVLIVNETAFGVRAKVRFCERGNRRVRAYPTLTAPGQVRSHARGCIAPAARFRTIAPEATRVLHGRSR